MALRVKIRGADNTVQEVHDGNPVPVTATSMPLPGGAATETKQNDIITELQVVNSLTRAQYDYIALSYTGADLTGVVFRTGGAGGAIVSTLTLVYAAGVLTSVTRT